MRREVLDSGSRNLRRLDFIELEIWLGTAAVFARMRTLVMSPPNMAATGVRSTQWWQVARTVDDR